MKIKNTILTAVCICFLCLLGSMQVYAAEYYGNFQYEDNGENISIYAYNGSDKEVTIPAYINDKAVTEINDYAFLLCNSVDNCTIYSYDNSYKCIFRCRKSQGCGTCILRYQN